MTVATDTYTAKRKQYLDHEITHREFYAWLADHIGVTSNDVRLDAKSLVESTDPHFNDIAIDLWDGHHSWCWTKARLAGLAGWSPAATVCVMKEVARQKIGQ